MMEKVDGSPTLREWPVRIWDESEIPPLYRPYLTDWLREGLLLSHLLFVPALRYREQSVEYMLAVREGEVLLLTRMPGNTVSPVAVRRGQLLYAVHITELLYSRFDFYWADGGPVQCASAVFNRTTLDLFLPALHTLLGLPMEFDCRAAASLHPRPAALERAHYALYQSALDAYRLGAEIGEFHWRRLKLPLFHRPKNKQDAAVLSCCMENGLFLHRMISNRLADYYFPWQSVSPVSEYRSDDAPAWEVLLHGPAGERRSAVRFSLL